MSQKPWSLEQTEQHLETNCGDTYSLAVVTAALFLRLYGRLPKMGLSGAQAEYATNVAAYFPPAKG